MILLFCLLAQDFSVLDSGIRFAKPGNDAIYERIGDEAALKALWERVPAVRKKDMPKVDFSAKMVFVLMPFLESDRKQLKVESVKEEKGTLTVTYSLTQLAVDGGPGPRLPYALVEVPRSAAPARVVEILKEMGPGKQPRVKTVKEFDAIK
jgi:hypothetical protein